MVFVWEKNSGGLDKVIHQQDLPVLEKNKNI